MQRLSSHNHTLLELQAVQISYKTKFNLIPEPANDCEDYGLKKCKNNNKISPSKELLKKSVKKRMCKCHCDPRAIKK
nr:unnamed protein product [Callosobruchus analis]